MEFVGSVKNEFSKFVALLAKTQKKLSEASNTIEFATKKSKTIERKLKDVATLNDAPIDLQIEEIIDDAVEQEGEEDE